MNNHSIRKFIITGVVVLAVFALANMSMDKKGENLAYYPIEKTSNVFAAFDARPDIVAAEEGVLEGEVVDETLDQDVVVEKESILSAYDTLLQSFVPGVEDPMIYVIEFELQNRGLFELAPDMTFGYKTLDGVKMFQQKNNLPVTGIVDEATMSLLLS